MTPKSQFETTALEQLRELGSASARWALAEATNDEVDMAETQALAAISTAAESYAKAYTAERLKQVKRRIARPYTPNKKTETAGEIIDGALYQLQKEAT